jgi:uncharacterized membrane protein HdeD (DUF308 family)
MVEKMTQIMGLIMFLIGVTMMIWSAISLSWTRLIVGIIFLISSISYNSYLDKIQEKEKKDNKRKIKSKRK